MSLLELLLALVVISIIITVGIQRYYSYYKSVHIAAINTDVQRIFDALNTYFYEAGCNEAGEFNGIVKPKLGKELNLGELSYGRSPFLNKYTTEIVYLEKRKKDNKPLYQFIITGEMEPLSPAQLQYLLTTTHGFQLINNKKQIKWQLLPTHDLYKPSANWLLRDRVQRFKQDFDTDAGTHCAQ